MPANVDSGFADWLKKGALFRTFAPDNAAAWAGKGVESEIVTPLATAAGADAEGARQADFMKGPNVKDRALVRGRRKDLIGQPLTLTGDRLGYTPAGVPVFVVGAEEQKNGTTVLLVVKRLG